MISHERLASLLSYDPRTGLFTWKVNKTSRVRAGDTAGSLYNNGYIVLQIDGKDYGAHRLAWFYVTGEWPAAVVDHRNCIKTDNRFDNLRSVSRKANSQNQREVHADKKSCKLLGATWDKRWSNWKAQLTFNKKTIYLGRFKTAEEAHEAYLEGKRRIHEGCTL